LLGKSKNGIFKDCRLVSTKLEEYADEKCSANKLTLSFSHVLVTELRLTDLGIEIWERFLRTKSQNLLGLLDRCVSVRSTNSLKHFLDEYLYSARSREKAL